jgi:hypothetical protein
MILIVSLDAAHVSALEGSGHRVSGSLHGGYGLRSRFIPAILTIPVRPGQSNRRADGAQPQIPACNTVIQALGGRSNRARPP